MNRTYLTLTDIGITAQTLIGAVSASNYGENMIHNLFDKYKYHWVIFQDDNESTTNKIDEWMSKFKSIYAKTEEKFDTMFGLYIANNDLMGKIESSTSTKFNDTPQSSGQYYDIAHISTYTETNTSVDSGTVIDRLGDVYDKYANLTSDWMNYFVKLFGDSTLY